MSFLTERRNSDNTIHDKSVPQVVNQVSARTFSYFPCIHTVSVNKNINTRKS
jgi:hypothetical protein